MRDAGCVSTNGKVEAVLCTIPGLRYSGGVLQSLGAYEIDSTAHFSEEYGTFTAASAYNDNLSRTLSAVSLHAVPCGCLASQPQKTSQPLNS